MTILDKRWLQERYVKKPDVPTSLISPPPLPTQVVIKEELAIKEEAEDGEIEVNEIKLH